MPKIHMQSCQFIGTLGQPRLPVLLRSNEEVPGYLYFIHLGWSAAHRLVNAAALSLQPPPFLALLGSTHTTWPVCSIPTTLHLDNY